MLAFRHLVFLLLALTKLALCLLALSQLASLMLALSQLASRLIALSQLSPSQPTPWSVSHQHANLQHANLQPANHQPVRVPELASSQADFSEEAPIWGSRLTFKIVPTRKQAPAPTQLQSSPEPGLQQSPASLVSLADLLDTPSFLTSIPAALSTDSCSAPLPPDSGPAFQAPADGPYP